MAGHKSRIVVSLTILLMAALVRGQAPPSTGPAEKPPLTAPEIEQLVAPIALYPDALLSQIFMAATYPLEVVQADRWAREHKDLTGEKLTAELEKQSWDPSVKSLVNFPQVLSMMNDKIELTMKLGDAFIDQQPDVMKAVQKLRAKAKAEGNLQSNQQQNIIVETAESPSPVPPQTTVIVEQAPTEIIRIEPADPQVIYVPTYSPAVVYGPWPYPAYPPAPYYPPGYIASNMISFGVGVACGAAWGYAWGHADWNHGDIDVDVNRNANFNSNIDRSKYQQNIQNRQTNIQNRQGNLQAGQGAWQHDPQHRQGVPYRSNASNQRFGNANQSAQAVQARDAYRGRAETGRQDLARGAADQYRGNAGVRPGAGGGGVQDRAAAGRGSVQNRAGTAPPARTGAAQQNRPAATPANRTGSAGGGAFSGVDRGGAAARTESQRGQASRSASPAPRSSVSSTPRSAPAAQRSAPQRSAPSRSAGGGGGARRR